MIKHKYAMRKMIYLSALLLLFVLPMMAQQPLFPTPAKVQNGKGSFTIGKNLQIQGNGGYADKLAAGLQTELKEAGMQSSPASGTIRLELNNDCKMADEAYTLVIEPNSILLQASSEAGLFYAKEALLQLSRFGKGSVRACKIQDQPRYGWRGFMLDESRHFFGKEKVKQYLDIMASLRLNVFHWHLTDEPGWRIEIKRYPKLTTEGAVGNWHDPKAPATFYTQEEIKEIVAYAADRHIMVVPEFDMPGHATAVCRSYPEISGGGPENGPDVGGVHDVFQHGNAPGIGADLRHGGEPGPPHGAQHPPGQVETRQLGQHRQVRRVYRDIRRAAGQHLRAFSLDVLALHQKGHRRAPGVQSPADDQGTLRHEQGVFRVGPVHQLVFRQPGVDIQLRRFQGCN